MKFLKRFQGKITEYLQNYESVSLVINLLYLKFLLVLLCSYTGVRGLGGLDPRPPPPESKIPYPDPNQTRCLGKILTKNVFLRPFRAIFRPASGIFRKVALPRFFELPTFDYVW